MIATSRALIRPFNLDDANDFYQMNADPLVRKFYPTIPTRAQSDQELMKIIGHQSTHGFSFWAIELDGNSVGFCGFARTCETMPFPLSVEIGWRLKSEYWRQGIMFEAATACLQHGFRTLGFTNIVSFTAELNIPSWSLMEKLEMKKESRFLHPKLPKIHPLALHRLYKTEI